MPQLLSNSSIMSWALAALAVYAIIMVLYKFWQFRDANLFEREFIEDAMNAVRRGDRAGATRILGPVRGPVARIMRVALEVAANRTMLPKNRRSEVLRVGNADLRFLESNLRGLELVAAVAPLMGLFGTVLGLINAFRDISLADGKLTAAMMASGIWQSLLAAAAGLVIAIPTLVAYHALRGIMERVRTTMQDMSEQILVLEDDSARPAEAPIKAEPKAEPLNKIEVAPVAEVAKKAEPEAAKTPEQPEAEKTRAESFDAVSLRLRSTPQLPEAPSMLNPHYGKVRS